MIPIQYQSSPILGQLVSYIYQHYKTDSVIDDFYNNILNIDTAKGYGLDVWGKIVGVERELTIKPNYKKFGFDTKNKSFAPFNQATFRNGEDQTTTFILEDDIFRRLIIAKAMANIFNTSISQINKFLQYLFEGRRCYCLDNRDMTIKYVFCFYLEPYEWAILKLDWFPRPAGVYVEFVEIPLPNVFGFHESGSLIAPFNQGAFYDNENIYMGIKS